jgi:hypothetical protein
MESTNFLGRQPRFIVCRLMSIIYKIMKSEYCILLLVLVCCTTTFAASKLPEDFGDPEAVKNISVLVLSSLERILQDETDIQGLKEAEIFCAKNEYEAFQIIIINPTDKPIPQIDLNADNWHFTGTPGEGSPELTLYREHYVEISSLSSRSEGKKGWYPDALIPFINPYTGKEIDNAKYLARNQGVGARKSQGYWVDIRVDSNVKAGDYSNEISVVAGGRVIGRIPVKLTVWDFELPKEHKLKTFFGEMRDVSSYHDVSKNSNEYKLIENRYENFLRDHGITLQFTKYLVTGYPVVHSDGQIIFDEPYISTVRSYIDRMHPSVFRVGRNFIDNPVARAQYLSNWEDFLNSNPWIPQAIIYFDEPDSLETYEIIINYGNAMNLYAPHIKLLVTEQIKPQKPDWPSLEGSVDIWVPLWGLADVSDIKRRQLAGDEVWSYTALDWENGVPYWLLDSPLLNYRIPAWFSYSLDLKGILYWSTMCWTNNKINPWVNPATHTKGSRVWNGEGSLIYPGKPAGIDGPVGSMRLNVFRDLVEDFDYLKLFESLTSRDQAVSQASSIAKDFMTYDKNPESYIAKRKAVAEMILNQMGKK